MLPHKFDQIIKGLTGKRVRLGGPVKKQDPGKEIVEEGSGYIVQEIQVDTTAKGDK